MAEVKWSLSGGLLRELRLRRRLPVSRFRGRTDDLSTDLGVCDVPLIAHIDKGKYGEVSLDGLNVAVVLHTPGPMGEGNWTVALDMNRKMDPAAVERMKKNGFRKAAVIKTGDRTYCFIGEWDNFDSIVKSRTDMIKDLDRMRDLLEDLGGGLGVTDPISGEVVAEM